MSDRHSQSSAPTGAAGCQISAVMQRKACPNKAIVRRWTGKRWVALCRKHDDSHGPAVGPLDTTERTVIVGTLGAVETTITEATKPEAWR